MNIGITVSLKPPARIFQFFSNFFVFWEPIILTGEITHRLGPLELEFKGLMIRLTTH